MRPIGEDPASSDRRWFEAVEEVFIRLRGAPLLLSPKDYRIAREWRQQGIPFPVVEEALEEVFRRRRERGSASPISSLSYCAAQVKSTWEQVRELSAPAQRQADQGFQIEDRLGRLREHLAQRLDALDPAHGSAAGAEPGRANFAQTGISPLSTAAPLRVFLSRLESLAPPEAPDDQGTPGQGGTAQDPESIEERLEELDHQLMTEAFALLAPEAAAAFDAQLRGAVAAITAEVPGQGLSEEALRALRRRTLRRQLALPVLSLFAPEAQEG
ncbi:MAG: hypothetical protein AAGD01_12250 [Acidobacteriota bacterium]